MSIDTLVFFKYADDVRAAIDRREGDQGLEARRKKFLLIKRMNPGWRDLSSLG